MFGRVLPMLLVLAAVMAACDAGSPQTRVLNGAISRGLQQGMTEQQVVHLSGGREPDRVAMQTCGSSTPKPFPCKTYTFDGGTRGGRYDSRLLIIFENVQGQWLVGSWS